MYWVRNAQGQTDEGDETSINPHVLYPHGRVAGAAVRCFVTPVESGKSLRGVTSHFASTSTCPTNSPQME